MPHTANCPQGHEWEADIAGPFLCPTCGARAVPSPAMQDETLARPGAPRTFHREGHHPAAPPQQAVAEQAEVSATPETRLPEPSPGDGSVDQTLVRPSAQASTSPSNPTVPAPPTATTMPQALDETLAPPRTKNTLSPVAPHAPVPATGLGKERRDLNETLPPPSLASKSGARTQKANLAPRPLHTTEGEIEETLQRPGDSALKRPLAPPPSEEKTPVSGYELLGILGRGGMGVVYKARQVGLNRIVALKMILGGGHASEEDLIRFKIEAEAVGRLDHPNIVQIYDVGERDGHPYCALEYIDGGSLQQKIEKQPLPTRQQAEIVEKLARAMHSAHQHGIVHRDLKPANVLLTQDCTPKITDFGLAKRLEDDVGNTGTGAILGTPTYMSPEQAQGRTKDIGPPADIYALGAIFYDLLTGRPPFRGETIMDTLHQVQNREPVPPARLQPKVPRDLQTICLKCLEKEPKKRYLTAEALADDLRRYLNGEPIAARPTALWERGWKWAKRRPAAAALVCLSSLVVLGLLVGGPLFAWHEAGLRQEADRARDDAIAQEKLTREQMVRADQNFDYARQAVDQMLTRIAEERLANEPRMEKVRRDLLVKALAFYQRFLEQKQNDPSARADAARAGRQVGEIQEILGNANEAIGAYQSAAGLFKALAAEQPGEATRWEELGKTYQKLFSILQAKNRQQEAEQAFQQALRIANKLASDFPDKLEYRLQKGQLCNDRGIQLQNRNLTSDAETAYRQAIDIFLILSNDHPQVDRYQLELARSQSNLGVLETAVRPAEAEKTYRLAIDILKQLVSRSPEATAPVTLLGQTYANLGVLLQLRQQSVEAEKVYRQAVELFARQAENFPGVVDYRVELARSRRNLGNLLGSLGRPKEAEQAICEARDLLNRLAEEFPTVPNYRRELALNELALGKFLFAQKRHQPAEAAFEQALELQTKLVTDYPDEPAYRQELANTHSELGILLADRGRLEGSEQNFAQAIVLVEELVARYPTAASYRQDAIEHEGNLAHLMTLLDRMRDAEKPLRRVIELQEKFVAEQPESGEQHGKIATNLNSLARVLLRREKRDEAAKILQRAFAQQREATRLTTNADGLTVQCSNTLTLIETLSYLKEHTEAVKQLKSLLSAVPAKWGDHARAAGVLARCMPLAEGDDKLPEAQRHELAQSYGDLAMKLFRQAIANGYSDSKYLRTSEDLVLLRQRAEFTKMVDDLESKPKPEKR